MFQMNIFFLLPLQESMVERSACQHDQWRGYMTVLVVNQGIIKFISLLTVVICPMIKFDVDKLRDCFRLKVKWMLVILYQFSTLSVLDLDPYTTFHTL
jgi:hypothetical protein